MPSSVPVDLVNPGQVIACIGLAEAAQELLASSPTVRAGFEFNGRAAATFHLDAGCADPVGEVLDALESATAEALVPHGSGHTIKQVECVQVSDRAFPIRPPQSPATLPARLKHPRGVLAIDHWGDTSRADNAKFWAGMGGYAGAAIAEDALAAAARPLPPDAALDPFGVSAVQSSTFRFDWRHDYIPIDTGYSLNNHGSGMTARGYPLVELLAAIGLTHARPLRVRPGKLLYRYGVLEGLHPLALLRPSLGCAPLPLRMRTFRIHLGWSGKKGQARCITDVVEEQTQ